MLPVKDRRPAPVLDPEGLRRRLSGIDFKQAMPPRQAIAFASEQLRAHQVHVGHPAYYGLFNPAPTTMGIAGDALVAAFNPQDLANIAWAFAKVGQPDALLFMALAREQERRIGDLNP